MGMILAVTLFGAKVILVWVDIYSYRLKSLLQIKVNICLIITKMEDILKKLLILFKWRYLVFLVLTYFLKFNCCGIKDFNQYDQIHEFSCQNTDEGAIFKCGVPYSCCKIVILTFTFINLDIGFQSSIKCTLWCKGQRT